VRFLVLLAALLTLVAIVNRHKPMYGEKRALDRVGIVLAALLLALFLTQTLVRLAMLWAADGSKSIVAVHALNIAALAAFAWFMMRFAKHRALPKMLIALTLGAITILLASYDLASAVALSFHQRIQPLSFLPIFYCNAESLTACARVYPGYTALLAALWLVSSALIYRASDRFAVIGTNRATTGVAAAILVLAPALWLFVTPDMAGREPLVRFFKKSQFGAEPRELITLPRPAYKASASPAAKPRPLVLIVVDSLRADAVGLSPEGASDMPFLRSLYAKGQLRNYGPSVATCATSYCGIVGLLSSSDWATLQQGPPLMLPDVLAANGYQSHYLLSGPHKRVLNLAALYGPNITTMLDDSSSDSSGLIDDREQVRRLRRIALPNPERSFIFVHLMSAHGAGLLFGDAKGKQNYAVHYRKKVQQADDVIRQLFATLKARDMLDDAIILITADHGERLAGEYGHGGEPDLDTALVPMLIYDQRGQWPGKRDDRITSAADVAPTLLAAAGIDIPRDWQGIPLQKPANRPSAPIDGKGVSAFAGFRNGKPTMVYCRTGKSKVKPSDGELFALWSRGWKTRRDAKRCFNHAQP
jgi:glucan phosphoethanolaminetransferase (alkaline phosphatase superfamily)